MLGRKFRHLVLHYRGKLLEHFEEVDICRRIEEYPDVTLEFWMAICKK